MRRGALLVLAGLLAAPGPRARAGDRTDAPRAGAGELTDGPLAPELAPDDGPIEALARQRLWSEALGSDPRPRGLALEALVATGGDEARQAAAQAARDEDPWVRQQVLLALAEGLPGEAARGFLLQALADPRAPAGPACLANLPQSEEAAVIRLARARLESEALGPGATSCWLLLAQSGQPEAREILAERLGRGLLPLDIHAQRALALYPDPSATPALRRGLPRLPPEARTGALLILALRGEVAARQELKALLRAEEAGPAAELVELLLPWCSRPGTSALAGELLAAASRSPHRRIALGARLARLAEGRPAGPSLRRAGQAEDVDALDLALTAAHLAARAGDPPPPRALQRLAEAALESERARLALSLVRLAADAPPGLPPLPLRAWIQGDDPLLAIAAARAALTPSARP